MARSVGPAAASGSPKPNGLKSYPEQLISPGTGVGWGGGGAAEDVVVLHIHLFGFKDH